VLKSFKSLWPPESRKSRISVIIRDKAPGNPQIILEMLCHSKKAVKKNSVSQRLPSSAWFLGHFVCTYREAPLIRHTLADMYIQLYLTMW
jgi:hypothetical protein